MDKIVLLIDNSKIGLIKAYIQDIDCEMEQKNKHECFELVHNRNYHGRKYKI